MRGLRHSYYAMNVLVGGIPVREYAHQGKVYVEALMGRDFKIRLQNLSSRVLAVPTIDGLSVMDGKVASYNSSGYVLSAGQIADIPGWRLNDREVAEFFFDQASRSYAAQMDKPTNVGVIGCAFFEEKRQEPIMYLGGGARRGDELELLGTKSMGTERSAGTGFGRRTEHEVTAVSFERASATPICVLEIYYDFREGLEKRGIMVRYGVDPIPNAFPAESGPGCPPPSGWPGNRK